jgi:hypothetical protein
MLIAPTVWNVTSSQVMGKFRIPKLSLPQMVQFVMEPNHNKNFSCSITYDDSKEPVIIPFEVLRYLYCFDYSQYVYTIPIEWKFEKYCDIELSNHQPSNDNGPNWSETRHIMCNIFPQMTKDRDISPFWGSTEFKLETQQIIRLVGKIGKKEEHAHVIVYFSKFVSIGDFGFGGLLEISKRTSGTYETFVTCAELGGSFKVYTKGSEPIKVEVITKRKIIMLFEDPLNEYEFKETIAESKDLKIPEWNGQTLVYRNFENLFDIGRHISHVYFPTILDPVKKPQVACLLGLSLSMLETIIFENREKRYICAELSGPFSLGRIE